MEIVDAWCAYTETLTRGLLLPSETDAPLVVCHWAKRSMTEAFVVSDVLQTLCLSDESEVETLSLDEFFEPYVHEDAILNAEEQTRVDRFKVLVDWFRKSLSQTRVYCIGAVNIDVAIVGQHSSGEWLGARTHLVET